MEWTAPSTAPVEPGAWAATSPACVGTERAALWMVAAPVLQAGEGRGVTSTVRMAPMVWTVKNAVTAVMLMDVTTPLVTVAVWLDGLVSTVTVCVQRAAGALTAPSPATVRTERPALRMKGPVSVLRDTEAPPVRGSARRVTSVTAAVRPVHSVSTATDHVTTSQDSATVCLASRERCATRFVQVDALGRTAPGPAAAQTTAPVTPSTAPVSVFPDGSGATARSRVLLVSGDPTASTHATVTTEPTAALMMESASVHQGGPAFTAHSAVHWVSMGRTVLRPASVETELTATTSLDSAHVAPASWDTAVNKSVLPGRTVTAAVRSATV